MSSRVVNLSMHSAHIIDSVVSSVYTVNLAVSSTANQIQRQSLATAQRLSNFSKIRTWTGARLRTTQLIFENLTDFPELIFENKNKFCSPYI